MPGIDLNEQKVRNFIAFVSKFNELIAQSCTLDLKLKKLYKTQFSLKPTASLIKHTFVINEQSLTTYKRKYDGYFKYSPINKIKKLFI